MERDFEAAAQEHHQRIYRLWNTLADAEKYAEDMLEKNPKDKRAVYVLDQVRNVLDGFLKKLGNGEKHEKISD